MVKRGLSIRRQTVTTKTNPIRLNIGCGEFPLEGWTNVEQDPALPAEVHATVPPIPYADSSVDEIYAGHFLEHLEHPIGAEFLLECFRVLKPGARLGIVVPDTWVIMREYVKRSSIAVEFPYGVIRAVADLDEVCALFLYSTIQDSPHRWSYDEHTLARALDLAGFTVTARIDRLADPRLGSGQWYQCGLDAIRPHAPKFGDARLGE